MYQKMREKEDPRGRCGHAGPQERVGRPLARLGVSLGVTKAKKRGAVS